MSKPATIGNKVRYRLPFPLPAFPPLPLSLDIKAVAPLPLVAYLTALRTFNTLSAPPPPSPVSLRARFVEEDVDTGSRSNFDIKASAADFSDSKFPSFGSNWPTVSIYENKGSERLTLRLIPRSFGSPSSFLSNLHVFRLEQGTGLK